MTEYNYRVEALCEEGKKRNTYFATEKEAWDYSNLLSLVGVSSIVYGKRKP